MPRKGIHPNYSKIKIKTFLNEDGDELLFDSCMVDGNDRTVVAEINIHKQPAWKQNGSSILDQDNSTNKQVDKFYQRFNKAFAKK